MALTKEDKQSLYGAMKSIKVEDLHASEDEGKRKWFRFGAYDALRIASEVVLQYPEAEKKQAAAKYICCEELEKALGDHKGLYSQGIGSLKSDELDDVIMYTGGEYKLKNPIIVQYCPFCGLPRKRASAYEEKA